MGHDIERELQVVAAVALLLGGSQSLYWLLENGNVQRYWDGLLPSTWLEFVGSPVCWIQCRVHKA